MDVSHYLAQQKKLTPGSQQYEAFIQQLDALGIVGIPLPRQKMPKFTPKYYTSQFLEERQEELGQDALKINLAIALQTLILKARGIEPQFEVVAGSLIEEYLKTMESEFEGVDEKVLVKLHSELTRKSRNQSRGAEDAADA
ncbi:MAG: hypothetical protein MH252_13170 [Thermosynechococcaceae cyanobacterium MS004]|nr:hypothetical protein [Thermosynechococcaceae cyanobacterium MS004]